MDPVLLSYHTPAHDLDVVARHVVKESLPTRLVQWRRAAGARELVYLATCQRVVWMLWGGAPEALRLGPEARLYAGEEAWFHLLSVAAGLESANMGDREIPGQIRGALEAARRVSAAGAEAKAALEDVVREAHRLRARLGLADGRVSVATAALQHLEEALEPGTSVAVVGVGPMSAYLAQRLPERGFAVTVANRTPARAEALAAPLGLRWMPLSRLQKDPEGFDAVVSATGSPEPLFTLDRWARLPQRSPLRLLDLALPPDSEAALERLPWVRRVDLDAFLAETATARAQRMEAALRAEPYLLASAARLRKRAEARGRKRELAGTQDRLQEAWLRLEAEALDSDLGVEQRDRLAAILSRGRTLAHRALAQGQALVQPPPQESGEGSPWNPGGLP